MAATVLNSSEITTHAGLRLEQHTSVNSPQRESFDFTPLSKFFPQRPLLTDYHAKFFAYELTKRCPSDSAEKLAGADQVDRQHDGLIASIESKLTQDTGNQSLFTLRWTLST
jgi:hypothetical protein